MPQGVVVTQALPFQVWQARQLGTHWPLEHFSPVRQAFAPLQPFAFPHVSGPQTLPEGHIPGVVHTHVPAVQVSPMGQVVPGDDVVHASPQLSVPAVLPQGAVQEPSGVQLMQVLLLQDWPTGQVAGTAVHELPQLSNPAVLPHGQIGIQVPLDWQVQILPALQDSPDGHVPGTATQELPQLSNPAVLPHGQIGIQMPLDWQVQMSPALQDSPDGHVPGTATQELPQLS